MQDIIVLLIILLILYSATRPLIKLKKETGISISCVGCSQYINGQCKIKTKDYETLLREIREVNSHKSLESE